MMVGAIRPALDGWAARDTGQVAYAQLDRNGARVVTRVNPVVSQCLPLKAATRCAYVCNRVGPPCWGGAVR
jgi:hypothetical protein